jgi:capsular polysaccharide biosynthesis protein
VLTPQGHFFTDDTESAPSRSHLLEQLAADPWRERVGLRSSPHRAQGRAPRFVLDTAGRPVRELAGTVVLLGSDEPSNFGSFLFRVLPKLVAVERLKLSSAQYLVWVGHESFRQFLALAGLTKQAILVEHDPGCITHAEHLIVPGQRNNQGGLDHESRAFFAELRARYGGPPQRGKRLYVSRARHTRTDPAATDRVMRNESELIERLAALGFTIVEPETLTAWEQIRLFSSAQLVVGPAGSGLFNVVFCHPGTRVIDIESEPHWLHAHRSLFASLELEYGFFVGRADDPSFARHHQPWEVNIDALLERIAVLR